MQNPLNESQRELLSAYLDGEVSAAEKQTAEELLQREDAQEYLESLRATVKLVTDNAPVHAPVGLSGRVMNSLKDEVKLVDPGSEPFTALPRISWQAPIWAAAAAIAVSVAIMFGPSLFNTKPQGPAIARDVLDNLPTRTTPADEQVGEKPEGTNFDGVETDGDMREELAARKAGENAKKLGAEFEKLKEGALNDLSEDEVQNDPSDSVADKYGRRAENAESEKKGFANRAGKTTEEREESEGDADVATLRKEGEASGTGAAEGAKKNGEKNDNNWDSGAGGGRSKAAKSKDETQGVNPPEPQPRRNRDDANDKPEDATARPDHEADDRNLEDNKREARGGVVPPAAPSKEPAEAGPDNEMPKQDSAIEVKLTEGGLAAQTDVLWISKLYGDAKIADGDEDVESIEVEVDANKLPELMAALRKLADEQGYGTVEGEPALGRVEQAQPEEGESARKISGYLPVEEEREQHEPNAAATPAERIKLVIRMK